MYNPVPVTRRRRATASAEHGALGTNDVVEQFRNAIVAAGLTPPDEIETDGKLHRFATNGKAGDTAGWYVFHGDGIPAGAFGDWRSGLSAQWRADTGRKLTQEEERAHQAKVEAMRREREVEEAKLKAEAASRAAEIWRAAQPAGGDHPYLACKGVKPYGLRMHQGALVVPMHDGDELHSLQFIAEDGDKRFLTGGRKKGCCFHIGKPDGVLCLCEGFVTAASVHEATGYACVVAFDAGNLLPVSQALRAKYPDATLILCADDDWGTEGNPGLTKAREAARAVGGLLAMPNFGADRLEDATDFNDMHRLCGAEAVKTVFHSVLIKAEATQATEATISSGAGFGVASNNSVEATEATSSFPSQFQRPCYRVFDDWLEHGGKKYRPGVWYFGLKADKKGEQTETETYICSPLYIEAVTFDEQDNNFGRLLRFKNTLGRWREWAMPMELLKGSGDELRGELLSMGVEIDPSAKVLLGQYLQSAHPKRRVHCALQVGWCADSFVLPDTVIGPAASSVIFQSGERGHEEYTKAGTLAGWQTEIAAMAADNPILLLAISASFAGPLLARCNAEGGGIHFTGDSSTGKTTVLEVACATWGGPNYRRSWRATANGLEGAAAMFNDCLLALDEISECEPREVGQVVYMLGNGRGKQRANRYGSARSVTRWRCFVLSSGERSITTAMAEGGYRSKAGQSVRLLDVPTARTHGAWDELHGHADGRAFSDALKRVAATHYGHAGRAFLDKLTRDKSDFCAMLEKIKGASAFSAVKDESQEKRTAGRFAMIALAGELATEYGITGWPKGAATKAAVECFAAWRSLRGKGNDERRQILEQARDFIERYGDGCFSHKDSTSEIQPRDRAGWWEDEGDVRTYLFTSAGLHQALKGHDFKRALDVLQEVGALPPPGADGRRAKPCRVGGRLLNVYSVQFNKLESGHVA